MNYVMYLRLFGRWFWLIALAIVISGGAAYYVAKSQPSIYQAVATVQVGNITQFANPRSDQLADIDALANTYFVLMKTRPYLQSIIQRAGLSMSPDDLVDTFVTNMVAGTPFFTITVTNRDPQTAAKIANAVGAEFEGLTNGSGEAKSKQIASAQSQVDSLQKQIASEQGDLTAIETCLKQTSCSDPILVSRQTELASLISQQQTNLAAFQNQIISLQSSGDINQLRIAQSAEVPDKAAGSSVVRDTVLAGGIGGAVSIGIVALIDGLNTTIRSASELPMLLRLPVLGLIPSYGRRKTYQKRLVTWLTPSSKAAEAFRVLRGNLMYIQKDRLNTNRQCYIVTSSRSGEGKSIIAANLAVSFTTIGQRVILIDADLRQPTQQQIFKLTNTQGLSDILSYAPDEDENKTVLTGDPTLDDSFFFTKRDADENLLLNVRSPATTLFYTIPDTLPIQKTEIPRLHVIASGTSNKNPADLVGSVKMRELVDHLIAKEGFDTVIIDTPAVLEVSDSSVLAGVVGAPVILVAEADRTSRNDAAVAVQRFSVLSLPVLGVILNRAKDSVGVQQTPWAGGTTQEVLALQKGSDGQRPLSDNGHNGQ